VLILSGFALLILMDAPRRAIAGFAVVGHDRWKRAVRTPMTDVAPSVLRRVNSKISVSQVPEKGRELAHNTTRAAVRTVTWLLGR